MVHGHPILPGQLSRVKVRATIHKVYWGDPDLIASDHHCQHTSYPVHVQKQDEDGEADLVLGLGCRADIKTCDQLGNSSDAEEFEQLEKVGHQKELARLRQSCSHSKLRKWNC